MRSSTLRRTVGRICRESLVRSSSRKQANSSHSSSPLTVAAAAAAAAAAVTVTSSSASAKRGRTVEESSPSSRPNKKQKTDKNASTSSFPTMATEILDLENDQNSASAIESRSDIPRFTSESIDDLRKNDLDSEDEDFDLAEIRHNSFNRPSEISCLDMLPEEDNSTSPFSLEGSALEEEHLLDLISCERQSHSSFVPQMIFRSPDLDHWPMDNIRPINDGRSNGLSKLNTRYDLSPPSSVRSMDSQPARNTEEVDESLLSEYVEYSDVTKSTEPDQPSTEILSANSPTGKDTKSMSYPTSQTVFAWASRRSLSPAPSFSTLNVPATNYQGANKGSLNVRTFSSSATTGIKRRSLWNGKARQMVSLGVSLDN